MNERVNDAARDAAARELHRQDESEYDVQWEPNADMYRASADAVLAAALPHLTAEDVPHITAQVYREAAVEAGAAVEGTGLMRAASLFRATAVANVMRALRAHANRIEERR